MTPPASSVPQFAPTSIWNQAVPSTAPLDPSSAALVSHLDQWVTSSEQKGNGPWINTTDYSTPIYTVPANQPTVPVYLEYANPLENAMSAVPMPSDAQPSAGTDAEMTIYQPSTDTLWEFWAMRQRLNAPPYLSHRVETGGSLPAGNYTYAVTALSANGETLPGPVQTYSVPAGGKVWLQWYSVIGAIGYRIYRGTDPQHMQLIQTVNHMTSAFFDLANTWTDDGSATPLPIAPPTANTATTPGQWYAGWGGRMQHVSSDPGYYRTIKSGGTVVEESDWGATASSLPVSAGLITLSDLASGQINHAIAMMIPAAKANSYVCPAQRTDGYDTSPAAIPEGAHFRLDPSLNLSTLPMPPITRMIAVAAQKYGLIVNDQTGVTVGFRAQDPMPLIRAGSANPYLKYFANPATGQYTMPSQFLKSFPWSHLQLLAPPRSCS